MTASEDFKLWMPVVVAVLTALLGILAFWNQKVAERRSKHKQDVQDRYQKYLHSIFDLIADPANKDRDAAFQKMRVSLRLFASADVLRNARLFDDHITRTNLVQDPNALVASLVNAIRNHVLPQSMLNSDSIPDSEMRRLNSFNVS